MPIHAVDYGGGERKINYTEIKSAIDNLDTSEGALRVTYIAGKYNTTQTEDTVTSTHIVAATASDADHGSRYVGYSDGFDLYEYTGSKSSEKHCAAALHDLERGDVSTVTIRILNLDQARIVAVKRN
jgi:hypothetical protein